MTNGTRHNNSLPLSWVSWFMHCYAECRYAVCHYAVCRGANKNILTLNWKIGSQTTFSLSSVSFRTPHPSLFCHHFSEEKRFIMLSPGQGGGLQWPLAERLGPWALAPSLHLVGRGEIFWTGLRVCCRCSRRPPRLWSNEQEPGKTPCHQFLGLTQKIKFLLFLSSSFNCKLCYSQNFKKFLRAGDQTLISFVGPELVKLGCGNKKFHGEFLVTLKGRRNISPHFLKARPF